jgi:hypothetical protein
MVPKWGLSWNQKTMKEIEDKFMELNIPEKEMGVKSFSDYFNN